MTAPREPRTPVEKAIHSCTTFNDADRTEMAEAAWQVIQDRGGQPVSGRTDIAFWATAALTYEATIRALTAAPRGVGSPATCPTCKSPAKSTHWTYRTVDGDKRCFDAWHDAPAAPARAPETQDRWEKGGVPSQEELDAEGESWRDEEVTRRHAYDVFCFQLGDKDLAQFMEAAFAGRDELWYVAMPRSYFAAALRSQPRPATTPSDEDRKQTHDFLDAIVAVNAPAVAPEGNA